jgi:hypothetical protein
MKQIAVRLSPASLAQLSELVEWRGETQSLVMRVALDRLHTDEARKRAKETEPDYSKPYVKDPFNSD